jgi:hypothetical protein
VSFLAPLFLLGLAAIAVPIWVHLIQREHKDVVPFPSLMFLERIPYQSSERRRIHNWWLLLFRLAAVTLVVAAFARPFLNQTAAVAAAITGAREVVILLDRSASMGYGTRWAQAQEAAQEIVDGLGGEDRATLVLFDRGVEEAVRATSSQAELELGISQATVSADGTRYAPALREAQSLLGRSERARKEAFLVSDFQRTGWERQESIEFPPNATLTPVGIGEAETSNLAITALYVQRETFSGQERVVLTAGLINRGFSEVTGQEVTLEIDGRPVGAADISLDPGESGTVSFDPVTVAEANIRGVLRAGTDLMPQDNAFYFVLSPSRTVSVLVLQSESDSADRSFYLTTVLGLSQTPPFTIEVAPASRFTPAMLDGRSVVVVNDTTALSTTTANALTRFVEQGGGMFIALGGNTPVSGDWEVLPGTLGGPIERSGLRGGTLGTMDSSHPIFQQFKDPRNGNFANVRFYRYRRLNPAPDDRVLARYDDGATAVAERRVGGGRVVAFTSTIDASWNDFPRHPMFLPVITEAMTYVAQFGQAEPSHTVGRMLDISAAVASLVREGQASRAPGGSGVSGVVVSPSGSQIALGGSGAPSIELAEQGFYSVRLPGTGDQRPFTVAVNLDPAESDLSAIAPADFVSAAIGPGAAEVASVGPTLEQPEVTPADVERRQSIWWYLLVIGLAALLIEAVLSNRLSKQSTLGEMQAERA